MSREESATLLLVDDSTTFCKVLGAALARRTWACHEWGNERLVSIGAS